MLLLTVFTVLVVANPHVIEVESLVGSVKLLPAALMLVLLKVEPEGKTS